MVKKEEINRLAEELLDLRAGWEVRDLDSYSLAELLMSVEKEYDIIFDSDEWEDLDSLDDLVCLINGKLRQS